MLVGIFLATDSSKIAIGGFYVCNFCSHVLLSMYRMKQNGRFNIGTFGQNCQLSELFSH